MEKQKKLSKFTTILNNSKQRKKTIIRSIVLIIFLLGVNTFAWFTYVSNVDVSINGSVISWEINFLDENGATNNVDVEITDMKPGMLKFEKDIEIINRSDIGAEINYEIKSVKFLGKEILQGQTTENIVNSLKNDYPFIFNIEVDNPQMEIDSKSTFKATMDWNYEEDRYYKLNSLYEYDPSIYYYSLTQNTYQIDNTVTQENFASKVENGLYIEKDDADTFFGEACGTYEKDTDSPCLTVSLHLSVTQAN